MHQFQGFRDLRVNSNTQSSDSTLWPSFTDIMTVIMMVFMLTMVVVILKNASLIDLVRLSQQQQSEIENRLDANLNAMADLRIVNTDLAESLRSKEMEIILLRQEADQMLSSLDVKIAIIDRLSADQEQLRENIRMIRLDLTENAVKVSEAELEIAALLGQIDDKESIILQLSDQKTDLALDLARQRRDFTALEDKYLKLIRPARSSMGKKVATVQYSIVNSQRQIMFKDIDNPQQIPLTRAQLYERLDALKALHGAELYVKIVIPDNSGLSYNEAWNFTKEVLSNYDYYYIDGWPDK